MRDRPMVEFLAIISSCYTCVLRIVVDQAWLDRDTELMHFTSLD